MAQDLMQKYRMSSVLIKLIVINAVVFFIFYLGAFFLQISEASMKSLSVSIYSLWQAVQSSNR